ncbi:hypothetical protein JTZ10_16225 [Gordonia rubripertincta]|uniref:HEPN AbiJ-N-terminal domain-containing protein n=1 Tax=Gordonia rubripertincta TaxID=36822 RepID=A0AAW4G891_GORRU|nr:hypothetical protein [Gordonia rubripertincta]MBM7279297.1 hypothetical protein [Gordonia rubripertincta]
MQRFSERYGFVQPKEAIQLEWADDELRMGLWNVTYVWLFDYPFRSQSLEAVLGKRVLGLAERIWMHELHKSVENFSLANFKKTCRSILLDHMFHESFDLIEAIVREARREKDLTELEDSYNHILATRRSAYRFIDGILVPLSNTDEVAAIEVVITSETVNSGARNHLRKSLALLGDRTDPDYANSIKEAISSVEAAASDLAPGKSTLGPKLEQIKSDFGLHPALVDGWKKLYGATSDEPGIRHGSSEISKADPDMARYYVVMCSAMVGYLAALRASGAATEG